MIQVSSGQLATAIGMAVLAVGLTVVLSGAAGADSEAGQGCVSGITSSGPKVVCYGRAGDTHQSLTSTMSYMESRGVSFEFVPCTIKNFVVWQRTGFGFADWEWITDQGLQPAGSPEGDQPGRWVSFAPDIVISRCGSLYAWKVNGFRSAIIEPDSMTQGRTDEPAEGLLPGEWVELRLANGFYTYP